MMNILPKTKLEWMQLALLPFKFCIFLIPLVFVGLMIENGTNHFDRMPIPGDQIINLMIVGYVVCIIILAIGGIYAAISMRNWKLMRSGLVFAGIGVLLFFLFIGPGLAATK